MPRIQAEYLVFLAGLHPVQAMTGLRSTQLSNSTLIFQLLVGPEIRSQDFEPNCLWRTVFVAAHRWLRAL